VRIVFLGAPGAGKGTQTRRISENHRVPGISTGDLLRAAIREGTELGGQARTYMDRGQLVPDDLMIGLIRERIAQPDCRRGFVLDGFPRTLEQARVLDEMLAEAGHPLQVAIDFLVPTEELIRRLSGRRVCRQCGASFHLISAPSRVAGVCDHCGGPLYQRDDDNVETVSRRLEVHNRQTRPIAEYYRQRGLLQEVDGSRSIEEIQAQLEQILLVAGAQ